MSLESVIQNLRNRKDGRMLLHVVLWLFYFLAIYYLENISFNSFTGPVVFYEPLKATATTILIYYPLIYFGWHRLLARKRYVAGILFIVSLVITYALVDHLLERLILESCQACMDK